MMRNNQIVRRGMLGVGFILFLAVFLTMAMPVPVAHAATITVQSNGDGAANAANCPGAGCRLRDAISAAAASGDTINFGAGVTGAITLSAGTLHINKDVTISGPGANILAIDGNATVVVVTVDPAFGVTISGLTIRNGFNTSGASGILNGAGSTLTLNNVAVSNNQVTSALNGCGGAGIFSGAGTSLTINNSTINNNILACTSGTGAGIATSNGVVLTLNNVTISGNSGNGLEGGGVFAMGTVNMNNVTITGNSAATGGGVRLTNAITLNFRNTIIAGNTATSTGPDCTGAGGTVFNSQGYNLIGNTSGCTIAGDLTGNKTGSANLGALTNNGGTTQTHALLAGSQAIDAGNPAAPGGGGNACMATDQRGIVRPQGTRCDMGAYEYQAPVAPTSVPPTSVPPVAPALPKEVPEGDTLLLLGGGIGGLGVWLRHQWSKRRTKK